ncbi:MAG: phosphatase PAP2 family protein, partial [Planctomycetes bacterium]|nr:phosphatase PAP2 family protein [Planctomycetota bacterium]
MLLLVLLLPLALWLDRAFFTWSQQEQVSDSLPHFRSAATEFGQPVGIAMIVLVVWALDRGRRRPLLLAVAGTLIAGGVASSLKLAIGRERPYLTEGVSVWRGPHWPRGHQPDSSFPSGHTAAAFAFAFALSRLYPPARGVFLSLAAACGASRALSGKH